MAKKVKKPISINCLLESDIDPIELRLRNHLEEVISEGDFVKADELEQQIADLDKIPVCSTEEEKHSTLDFPFDMPLLGIKGYNRR